MESGWNVWVWLVGVVSLGRVWLVGVGGIYGRGCKEVYRFPHTIYLSLLLLYLFFFTAASLLLFIFNSFLFQYFFVITFYVLNIFFAQYKHTYGQLRAFHGSHLKAAHTVLYMKHTQTYASYPVMDISCMSVV